METGEPRKPWYRRTKYVVILAILVVLVVASFVPSLYHPAVTGNQLKLNMTVDYFARNYDLTTGLITEFPGSHTYWLYSDNYLAILALERYDQANSSTTGFASALDVAFHGYLATAPDNLTRSQYVALNSTAGNFGCSADFAISWTNAGAPVGGGGSASIMTTANTGVPSCASQDYADLLLLQALYYHRLGNSSGASYFYNKASSDFNGVGFADLTSNSTLYETYKLALYLYTSSCLGQTSGSGFGTGQGILFSLQDNSTGGFYTGYTGPGHSNGSVNTETTALAALALEQMINPSGSC